MAENYESFDEMDIDELEKLLENPCKVDSKRIDKIATIYCKKKLVKYISSLPNGKFNQMVNLANKNNVFGDVLADRLLFSYKQGNALPRAENALILAGILTVSVSTLFGGPIKGFHQKKTYAKNGYHSELRNHISEVLAYIINSYFKGSPIELAKVIGKTKNAVNSWISKDNNHIPEISTLLILSYYLGVEIDVFFQTDYKKALPSPFIINVPDRVDFRVYLPSSECFEGSIKEVSGRYTLICILPESVAGTAPCCVVVPGKFESNLKQSKVTFKFTTEISSNHTEIEIDLHANRNSRYELFGGTGIFRIIFENNKDRNRSLFIMHSVMKGILHKINIRLPISYDRVNEEEILKPDNEKEVYRALSFEGARKIVELNGGKREFMDTDIEYVAIMSGIGVDRCLKLVNQYVNKLDEIAQ
jgi:transcriptional regulator with XRE-family HTH domain